EKGEPITWDQKGDPVKVDGNALHKRVHALAACALLARHWPGAGSKGRHDCALILGGFLARAGKTAAEARLFVEAICGATSDEELPDRIKAVNDAAAAYQKGDKTCGLAKMRECFGQDIGDKVAEWLDYRSQPKQPEAPVNGPDIEPVDLW